MVFYRRFCYLVLFECCDVDVSELFSRSARTRVQRSTTFPQRHVLDENGRCGDVPVGTFLDKYRYLISPWVFNVVSGVLRL